MSHGLIIHEQPWDENNIWVAMMNIAIPRIEAIEAPQNKIPLPLESKHYALLTCNYRIAPPLVVDGPFFSLQNDSASLKFLRDVGLESAENSSFDSLFEPEFGAIGVSDFDLEGQIIGHTLLGLRPGWEGGSPPAILQTTSIFSRVGIYPFTRQLMQDIHPRFPFMWSYDAIQCMTAASYGMPAFHIACGTSRDHEAHRDHLLRDLKALKNHWQGATTMPQHLLLGSTLDPRANDFRAMDLVESELKRQGLDVIRTTSPYGWTGQSTEIMAALGIEALFTELFNAPLMQFELDMFDL